MFRRRVIPCPVCRGRGIAYQPISRLPGLLANRPCRRCRGRGSVSTRRRAT